MLIVDTNLRYIVLYISTNKSNTLLLMRLTTCRWFLV